ncbi:MAG: gluconokinase [Candidatus Bathyarchaeota archaeon]|nr:gluconokinase [Candidatus Bathyarchaeota archaeon]
MHNQNEIINALWRPSTYEYNPGKIELIQTHISFIFLTEKFVYKVKKAVDFGFLDFGSLEKRREFCEKELEINRKLCDDMYLEVVPINKSKIIKIKGKGKTLEYAVKMKRIPQYKLMNKLLEENKINKKIIDKIARIIADFHSKIEYRSDSGNLGYDAKIDPIVEINWKENFEQTKPFIGKTISFKEFCLIQKKIEDFIRNKMRLFKKRMANGKVKYCHGDIHSGNIFIADKIYIFDAIEFNDRIRYTDVLADIGFLAMDLEFRNNPIFASFLIERYSKYSEDKDLKKLLSFYKCYRAYVRGKVVSFRLNDINIDDKEKQKAKKEAQEYFKLSSKYAKSLK